MAVLRGGREGGVEDRGKRGGGKIHGERAGGGGGAGGDDGAGDGVGGADGNDEGAGVGTVGEGDEFRGKFAVLDFRLVHIIREGEDLEFAGGGAGVDAAADGVGGDAAGEVAVEAADGGAPDVILEDEVDDAGDGIGAVDGGGAVLEDLDAGDGVDGDHVEVDKLGGAEGGGGAALGEGRGGDATAVEEDEGGVGAETAEGNGGGAGRGSVDAVFTEATGAGLGDFSKETVETAGAGLLDLGRRDEAEVGSAGRFAGAEVGAGDGEGFEFHGGLGGSRGLSVDESRQGGDGEKEAEVELHGRRRRFGDRSKMKGC